MATTAQKVSLQSDHGSDGPGIQSYGLQVGLFNLFERRIDASRDLFCWLGRELAQSLISIAARVLYQFADLAAGGICPFFGFLTRICQRAGA